MALTPKEAFEAVKKLWPKVAKIVRKADTMWEGVEENGSYGPMGSTGEPVNWDNTTEYPVPAPKWRDACPEDLTWPFKEARFRDNNTEWTLGQLAGYFPSISYPWADKSSATWRKCQVRDES